MTLTEIIVQKIKTEGIVSFYDFMEMALYYPNLGYYTSPRDKIGKQGDYYTSPSFTCLYGQLIAKQLEEMWLLLGKKPFTVVEYGAGMGLLSLDILNQLKSNPQLYEQLNYFIIEKSEAMKKKEKTILNEKVTWYNSIQEIPKITGCILSNELLDNFSIHQVVMCDELMEVYVDYQDGFVEVLKPAPDELKDYLTELNVELPKGFRTEINIQLIDWIKDLAASLEQGFVLTIDYGFTSSELYRQHRRLGTLTCYNNHKINDNPYQKVGDQDITAHVNFSALNHWGELNGLKCCGFTEQANFLRSLGLVEHLRKMEGQSNPSDSGTMNNMVLLHTLLMDMGTKFKVLIQQKGMQESKLSGLQFSQKNC